MTQDAEGQQDARWLAEAVELAVENVGAGGGPFGALIVRDGAVIATGVNAVTTTNDPTAHAEVVAIRTACRAIGDFRLDGCVLVTSCEPCPLCLAASLWARLDRVIYAADRHDAARGGFDDLAFYELFATPRERWPMTVTTTATADSAAPFAAWLAKPDRVDY
ncbi:MAG TPA: nucleoside deaminase [Baekduia sp.]|jgi:tRNA(Arg) A34 adenosine deaminase TadA